LPQIQTKGAPIIRKFLKIERLRKGSQNFGGLKDLATRTNLPFGEILPKEPSGRVVKRKPFPKKDRIKFKKEVPQAP